MEKNDESLKVKPLTRVLKNCASAVKNTFNGLGSGKSSSQDNSESQEEGCWTPGSRGGITHVSNSKDIAVVEASIRQPKPRTADEDILQTMTELLADSTDEKKRLEERKELLLIRQRLVASLLELLASGMDPSGLGGGDTVSKRAQDSLLKRLAGELALLKVDLQHIESRLRLLEFARKEWMSVIVMMNGISVTSTSAEMLQAMIFSSTLGRIRDFKSKLDAEEQAGPPRVSVQGVKMPRQLLRSPSVPGAASMQMPLADFKASYKKTWLVENLGHEGEEGNEGAGGREGMDGKDEPFSKGEFDYTALMTPGTSPDSGRFLLTLAENGATVVESNGGKVNTELVHPSSRVRTEKGISDRAAQSMDCTSRESDLHGPFKVPDQQGAGTQPTATEGGKVSTEEAEGHSPVKFHHPTPAPSLEANHDWIEALISSFPAKSVLHLNHLKDETQLAAGSSMPPPDSMLFEQAGAGKCNSLAPEGISGAGGMSFRGIMQAEVGCIYDSDSESEDCLASRRYNFAREERWGS